MIFRTTLTNVFSDMIIFSTLHPNQYIFRQSSPPMYFQTCPPDWDVESDKERPRTSIPAGDPCCFHFVLVFVFVFVLFLAFDKKKILIILIISTILIISLQRCFLVTWPLFMHLEQMAFRLSLNRFIENCLNRFFVCFFDIF